MPPELQREIDKLNKRISALENQPTMPDHRHNGFDVSRVKFADLDTVIYKEATINPGSLADGVGETEQVTGVTGATLGDFVIVSAPYDLQDMTVTAYVQANDVVEIRVQNESGSTINLDSGTWRILVIRKLL